MSDFVQRMAQLSPRQLTALALSLHKRLEEANRVRSEPIAVVGMGCRFPGAKTPQEFWDLLQQGREAIIEAPANRLDLDAYYHPDPEASGKIYTRHGAFLDSVDQFDPGFFGISPREAVSMDPQQRLLLEVCWEALENAGQAPDRLAGSLTGVFVGIGSSYYSEGLSVGRPEQINAYTGTGNATCIAAGRISYILGLQGPNFPVETACSSALLAVHLACQSLRNGECRMALAGGVNLMLALETTVFFCKVRLLSPSGRCRPFAASADGFVRGEGCGMVVLKRLSDAVADGDSVLAVIRGSATNHDGKTSGLLVPNRSAQETVIRTALARAELSPEDLQYVEGQGTGTILGDSIEIQALGSVFAGRPAAQPLLVGSAKGNIGHLELASGAASLIKAILALQHGQIPAQPNLDRPNEHVDWDSLPIRVPTALTPWPQTGGPRRCGVSSFGFSGSNVHAILEQAPPAPPAPATEERPWQILCLSAKTEPALHHLAAGYLRFLDGQEPEAWGDVCFSANAGRSHFAHRLALLARSPAEAREQLQRHSQGQTDPALRTGYQDPTSRPPRLAFLFPGVPRFPAGLAQELSATQPLFRQALEDCDRVLRTLPHSSTNGQDPAALFSVEYALAQLWRGWGIEPAAVLGEGLGEWVAACQAGIFSLDDALRLVVSLGQSSEAFSRAARAVAYSVPKIGFVSSSLGGLVTREAAGPGYWLEQPKQPARLREAFRSLVERRYSAFLEMGPACSRPFPVTEVAPDTLVLASCRPGQDPWVTLLDSLARLYIHGARVDWGEFEHGYSRKKVILPNYPFQRTRCWSEKPITAPRANGHLATASPEGLRNGETHSVRDHETQQLRQSLQGLPAEKRQELIAGRIREELARVLKLESSQEINTRQPLLNLGLDSLMLVELKDRLETLLEGSISPSVLLGNPCVEDLAAHLAHHLDRSGPVQADARMARMVQALEEMSEEEAQALLARRQQEEEAPLCKRLRELSPAKRELLLLEGLGQEQPALNGLASEPEVDLEAEVVLPADIKPSAGAGPAPTEPSAVLLTGATGFLGAYLLHELLRQTRARIYCVVRAGSLGEAQTRISKTLRSYDLDPGPEAGRIIPVVGDLERPMLGLSGNQLAELAEQVEAVYHNGAVVHFVKPYAQLKAANVLGTIEALKLACQGRAKRFHLISSLSVFASPLYLACGLVPEDAPLEFSLGLTNGYVQSKWVSERITTLARDRGLEVVIYRPGLIASHTRTGHGKLDDLLPRLVKGCVQLGCVPEVADGLVDYSPVDYVSEAIVYLSRLTQAVGKAFNFLNPKPLTWQELADGLESGGYAVDRVPPQEWVNRLRATTPDNVMKPLLPLVDTYVAAGLPVVQLDSSNTRQALAGSTIHCLAGKDLLHCYLEHFTRMGYVSPPEQSILPCSAGPSRLYKDLV